jgi:hypothetical protein
MKKSVSIYVGRAAYIALFFTAMLGLYSYLETHKVPQSAPALSPEVNEAKAGS